MRQRLLFTWLALLLGVAGANAKEAYAYYMESDHSLNFCYDDSKASRAQSYPVYSLNTNSYDPEWLSIADKIEELYFYSSFADYRPTSCYKWAFQMSNLTRVRNIQYLNTSNVTNMDFMFAQCNKLTTLDVSGFNTSNVTTMGGMFEFCFNLESISGLTNWNTSKVTAMGYMFYMCNKLTTLNLSNFNTSNVYNMNLMFTGCTNLTSISGLTKWNTAEVKYMSSMFSGCEELTSLNVSSFNTEKVTYMDDMFYNCKKLTTLDVSSFNTENVTDMGSMFKNCYALKSLKLSSSLASSSLFDSDACIGVGTASSPCELSYPTSVHLTSSFTTITPDYVVWKEGYFKSNNMHAYAVFNDSKLTFWYDDWYNTPGTNYDLNTGSNDPAWHSNAKNITSVSFSSSFKNARPTSCYSWFYGMYNLNSISGMESILNTSKVTTMQYMFYGCKLLKSINTSNFNTNNVTSMNGMFMECRALTNVNVSSFNTSKVTDMTYMFDGCDNLASLDLSNFDMSKLTSSNGMMRFCSKLSTLTIPSTANKLATNACLGIGYTDQPCKLVYPSGFTPEEQDSGEGWYKWKSGYFYDDMINAYAFLSSDGKTLTFYYDANRFSRTGGTAYSLDYNEKPAWYDKRAGVTKVVFNSTFANARPEQCDSWFEGMSNLTTITGLSYLNTSEVIWMNCMFKGCSKLTSIDLSKFNTTEVVDMNGMFQSCSGLTSLNLSNFNTSNVLTMGGMFAGCTSLSNLDLSKFNTSNVFSMASMFEDCSSLTSLNLSSFDTRNIFSEQDFDIHVAMDKMFSGCSKLTNLDISSFTIPAPFIYFLEEDDASDFGYDMEYVKDNCLYIYVGREMFKGCSSLKTLSVPASAANIDLHACDNVGTKTSPCTLVYPSGFTPQKDATGDGWYQWKGGYFIDSNMTMAYAWLSSDGKKLTFCYDKQRTSRTGTTYSLNTGTDNPGWYDKRAGITSVVFNPTFVHVLPTSCYRWFYGMSNLTSITRMKECLNTAGVTNMGYMFCDCSKLTNVDVSGFKTSNVTKTNRMFYNCSSLTDVDVRSFKMSKVTDMSLMFFKCQKLTSLDLSNFTFKSSQSTTGMMRYCTGLSELAIPSTANYLDINACELVGTTATPCTLVYPSGFTPDKQTTGDGWYKWKGGYFKDASSGNLGDANGDGEVTVNDVQMVVEYVLGKNPSGIVLANCDVTGDNEVSINDVNAIVSMVLNGPAAIAPNARESLTDMVALTARGSHCSLHLNNSEPYHAFQLEVVLPEGGSMSNVTLAEGRSNGHHAEWSEVTPGRYNVVVYATNGEALRDGSTTALMHFDIAGCKADDVSVEGIQMIDGWCRTVLLPSTSGVATGIAWVVDDASEGSNSPYYNTVGVGSNTPQRGVNIKDGRKVVKK